MYKASNFACIGRTAVGGRVIWHKGKKYHDKAIRTKYKGKLKPFALKLKNALDKGEAEYRPTKGKICYTYQLKPQKEEVKEKKEDKNKENDKKT